MNGNISKLEIIFCVFPAENNFVNALIPFIGVKRQHNVDRFYRQGNVLQVPAGPTGFSLVELMISLAVGMVVLGAIYGIFTIQHKAFSSQDRLVEMQQCARAALDTMVHELRMVGYNPCGITGSSNPRIITATAGSIRFTMDIDANGDTEGSNEDVKYSLYTAGGIQKLGRATAGGYNQPLAENIQALSFNYTLTDGTQTAAPSSAQLADIVGISIVLTARTAQADPTTRQYKTYALTSQVMTRNLQLSSAAASCMGSH